MKNAFVAAAALACWIQVAPALAQFGQTNVQRGANVLPGARTNMQPNGQFSPFAYGNPYATSAFNTANGPFNYNNWNNPYGPMNPFYSGINNWPYATPWVGNPFGPAAGFSNFGGPLTYFNGYNNFNAFNMGYGMNQLYGWGGFAPIVGANNGWWPYYPAYNPYNPVNQALTNLYLQGLPNMNNLPGNSVLPR